VVTRFGDAAITNASDLVAAIAVHQPGDQVKITAKRGSETAEMTVTLGTQPAQSSSGG
jgi:S1-C subfamily serine protease